MKKVKELKNIALIIALALLSTLSIGQECGFPDPDDILRKGEDFPEVLLVGTFHFSYPNLDAHKTNEEDQINVLSPKRQKEMEELNEYIAQFKPTKIVVERGSSTGWLMDMYRDWLDGKHELGPGEIYQIGFNQMKLNGLDTIYGCDSYNMMRDMLRTPDSLAFERSFDKVFEGYSSPSKDIMDERYMEWYDDDDVYTLNHTLLETFKNSNSIKNIQRSHGAYLVGDFKTDDYDGADAITLYWYSRNLRIFREIQKINASGEDRILVLFGGGHVPILREQFIASPEFDLVDFNSLESYKPS